jgi:hypothetical protein
MPADIRNKPTIDHSDVLALNFINTSTPYILRKHFRQGLRSHIMEILDPTDVQKEHTGIVDDGVRWFPRAQPVRMFRIFRSRLTSLDRALKEIGRVKLVERYLAPDFMATSTECIVDYRTSDGYDLLLCGFQEVVIGEILDPWTLLDTEQLLPALYEMICGQGSGATVSQEQWIETVRQRAAMFVEQIKRMIVEAEHIPDLAGAGNLFITGCGDIRLVDINNISPVFFDSTIHPDEKGYPVCDKSIEALSLIERKIFDKPVDMDEDIYRFFLNPTRCSAVKENEARFWKANSQRS